MLYNGPPSPPPLKIAASHGGHVALHGKRTEVGLDPGHIVLDGEWDQALPPKGAQQPLVDKLSPISATVFLHNKSVLCK